VNIDLRVSPSTSSTRGQLPIQTTGTPFNLIKSFWLSQSCTHLMTAQRVSLSSVYATKPFSNASQQNAKSQQEPDVLVQLHYDFNIPVTRLKNNIRKNSDAGLFNFTSGPATLFPGVVVEVGYSDSLKKSRRDISLWLDNSDLAVVTHL
jgi:hypothetical protein